MPDHRYPNYLSGPYLERLAHQRKNEPWLSQALASEDALFVPVWRARNLVTHAGTPKAQLLTREHAPTLGLEDLILLGEFHGRVSFAYELPADRPPPAAFEQNFHELRSFFGTLPEDEAGLLAYARAMLIWRERHRFCGRCGTPTVSASAGHVRRCSNPECGLELFPRIDPAIIVLITDGERALLGRQAAWPEGRYSTIAGFVEPGESLEDAVAREVFEETGVRIERVDYHSSQPWPFPSSLMLGFTAYAATMEISRNDAELEDARWFTRAQLAAGEIAMPTSQSISFRLIEEWYDSAAERPLRTEPNARLWTPPRG